jgi:malonyl-CoA O-methyltransferase
MLQRNPITSIALSTTEAIPLSAESVDVVLCGLALGHLLRLEPSLNEINRILKPGGIALLSDFHPFIALKGGQRTFTAPDGKTYAAEHHIHLYADYHRAASQSGLHIEHVAEPYLDAPGAPANRLPVVLVLRLRKPG